jgi:hypothetical protein
MSKTINNPSTMRTNDIGLEIGFDCLGLGNTTLNLRRKTPGLNQHFSCVLKLSLRSSFGQPKLSLVAGLSHITISSETNSIMLSFQCWESECKRKDTLLHFTEEIKRTTR